MGGFQPQDRQQDIRLEVRPVLAAGFVSAAVRMAAAYFGGRAWTEGAMAHSRTEVESLWPLPGQSGPGSALSALAEGDAAISEHREGQAPAAQLFKALDLRYRVGALETRA